MALNSRPIAVGLSLALVFGIGVTVGALLSAHSSRHLASVQQATQGEGNAAEASQSATVPHVVTNEQVIVRTETRYVEDAKIAEIESKVDQQDAAVWPQYESLLTDLGFDAAQKLYVRTNLMQMHRLAIKAGDPLLELAMLRQKFDETLAKELPQEAYVAFKRHETQKPAAFEVQRIREQVSKLGGEPDPAQEKQVMEVIWESGLARSTSWLGPYDPPPQPMAGNEAARRVLETDIKAIEASIGNLREKLINKGVSEEFASSVIAFYEQGLVRKRQSLGFMQLSPEEKDAFRNRQIEERLNKINPAEAKSIFGGK